MTELIIGGVAMAGIITGAVEVFKQCFLPTRYAGLLALGLGIALGVVYHYTYGGIMLENVIFGAVAGMVSAGVYSGTKALIKK